MLWIDIVIGILELLYTFFIVILMDYAVRHGLSQDVSRKIVHMWAGGLVIFWFFYTSSYGMYIFLTTPAIWVLLLVYTALTRGPEDPTVRSMTRTGNPRELLLGVLFFPLMIIIITIIGYRTIEGVVAIASVGFGDGIAPIIGKYYGAHKYRLLGREKSLEGSLSVYLGTVVSSLLLSQVFFGVWDSMRIFLASLVAVLLEAISPRDVDNFIVPLGVWAFFHYLLGMACL